MMVHVFATPVIRGGIESNETPECFACGLGIPETFHTS